MRNGRKAKHPKRSHAAVIMRLEEYICHIGEQYNRLRGGRFAELEELEQLYHNIAKRLQIIVKEMREIADDKSTNPKKGE